MLKISSLRSRLPSNITMGNITVEYTDKSVRFHIRETTIYGYPDKFRIEEVLLDRTDNLPLLLSPGERNTNSDYYHPDVMFWIPERKEWIALEHIWWPETAGHDEDSYLGPYVVKSEDYPAPLAGKPKVFICHASEDEMVARELYRKLNDKGYEPWLNVLTLSLEQGWNLEIQKTVRKCHSVIVCLSKRSVNNNDYIEKEIQPILEIGRNRLKDIIFVIPLKLEDCQVPEMLKMWHWINAHGEGGDEKLFRSLELRAIQIKNMPQST